MSRCVSGLRNVAVAVASLSAMAVIGLRSTPAQVAAATPRAPQALLVGVLGYEGGAPPGIFHRTSGTVYVSAANPPITIAQHVGASGHFRISLGAGSYTAIGCGPSSSGGQGTCGKPKNFTLSAGEVHHIRLVWAMVP